MRNEKAEVEKLNELRLPFQAWPIAPLSGLNTAFFRSWLFLVKPPASNVGGAFPSMTDSFKINLETTIYRPEGTFTLTDLPSTRIQNPYEHHHDVRDMAVKSCAAFKVDVPRSWRNVGGVTVELDLMACFQTAYSIADVANVRVGYHRQQIITITWDVNLVTSETELAALHHLTDEHRRQELAPSQQSVRAFEWILNFHRSRNVSYQDLHDEFPQLVDPFNYRYSHHISELLLDKVRAFDEDHRAALRKLRRVANGVYFVNGCPGSGKTEWNMVLAALLHSKKSPKSKRNHTPILFLVDINKTVDDAANRYHALCKEVGLDLRIIRMHGWPDEMKNSATLNKDSTRTASMAEIDFTKKFLATANLARHRMLERNSGQAPTLDQASWDYYEQSKDDSFKCLQEFLARMDRGQSLTVSEWQALRNQVMALYSVVLAKADFVATTPVAAYGSFSRLFEPDVIFIDEASHARELTALIPIAFFSPLVWIFTGDVNQTRPFVKSPGSCPPGKSMEFNPFAEQLRLSTMARAAAANAIDSQLLVNKRAYGNLHRLPSKMFYQGMMRSGNADAYPPSVRHLKGYLERLRGGGSIDENRLVVRLSGSAEAKYRSSFWNPAHHVWIMGQVRNLLADEAFLTVTGPAGTPGRIMIATPYSTAARRYQDDVRRWPRQLQDRVEVLTVDSAQGNQADVVFLDMVRTTTAGFMDDPMRLNVAITRARQAEVIVMHERMTTKGGRGWVSRFHTRYLSQIWHDALTFGRLVKL